MGEPFIGEIKLFSFDWPPHNWALCDGATLPVAQNQALYSLIGHLFGNQNTEIFNLPDLQGRVPFGSGNGYIQGLLGGEETVTLTSAEMPTHTHDFLVTEQDADQFANRGECVLGKVTPGPTSLPQPAYDKGPSDTKLSDLACAMSGGDQSHSNLQPTAVANYCIAIAGIYPPRS